MADSVPLPRSLRYKAPPGTRTSRVVLNREALDEVTLAVANGLYGVGLRILEVAKPPDDPRVLRESAGPLHRWYHVDGSESEGVGKGLPIAGGVLAYVRNKKVDGTQINGKAIKKTRALVATRNTGVQVFVGFGFPGRFVELGTVHSPAEPFLSPAVAEVMPEMLSIMREVGGPKLPDKPRA